MEFLHQVPPLGSQGTPWKMRQNGCLESNMREKYKQDLPNQHGQISYELTKTDRASPA